MRDGFVGFDRRGYIPDKERSIVPLAKPQKTVVHFNDASLYCPSSPAVLPYPWCSQHDTVVHLYFAYTAVHTRSLLLHTNQIRFGLTLAHRSRQQQEQRNPRAPQSRSPSSSRPLVAGRQAQAGTVARTPAATSRAAATGRPATIAANGARPVGGNARASSTSPAQVICQIDGGYQAYSWGREDASQ
eukprot:765798-Pelagomonas_calceolata.AAC.9